MFFFGCFVSQVCHERVLIAFLESSENQIRPLICIGAKDEAFGSAKSSLLRVHMY